MLGKGQFGEVYQVRDKTTNQEFALKKLLLTKVMEEDVIEELRSEIRNLREIVHPNVVRLWNVYNDS